MKAVQKFLNKKMVNATSSDFEPDVTALLQNESLYDTMIFAYYTYKQLNTVKCYIVVSNHHIPNYHKAINKPYCISTIYVKYNKCYIGNTYICTNISDILVHSKSMLSDFDDYDLDCNDLFEYKFHKAYNWQKIINNELVSEMHIRIENKLRQQRIKKNS